jgi:CubicO group peptidase (beta-lactamase class C family)
MRKQMETFFRLVLFCTATSVFAQTGTPAQLRLDQRVPIWLKAFNVTGVGVAYIQDGKIAWTAFYGDQIPGGPKANNETLYSVASLTKPVTAELILRLASQEKLSLDEPVFRYWTDPDVRANPWNQLLTPQL